MQPPYDTGDFDLVVQVSEREFNDQLAAMYAGSDSILPTQVRQTFSMLGNEGEVNFLFDTPWVHLGTDPQHRQAVARYDWKVSDAALNVESTEQISLFLPFSEAFVDIGNNVDAADVDGCVMVQHSVETWTPDGDSDTREIGLSFTDEEVERVEVGFTPETVTRLEDANPLLPALLRGVLQDEVETMLIDDVERIALSPEPFEVAEDDDPLTPAGVEPLLLRTGERALAFALPTRSATTGDVDAVGGPNTSAGSPVAILFDSETLLGDVIRPEIAAGMDASVDAFERPCRLTGSVDLDTSGAAELDDLNLNSLRARIHDGHIRIDGSFDGDGSAKGFPFTVDGDFRIRVYLELNDEGEFDVRVESEDPDVDVDFPAWVYVVAGGLGLITGGIAGAAVGATLVLVAETVADAVADSIGGEVLAEQLGAVGDVSVPLGPAAEGFELTEVDLTEGALALGGRPVTDAGIPVAARAIDQTLPSGTTVDLDTGDTYTGSEPAGVDVAWGQGTDGVGIYARSGADIAPLGGQSFRTLTVVDVEQADFEGSPYGSMLPASFVPVRPAAWFPVGSSLTFAVRTSEHRFTKCEVFRLPNGRLELDYVTYDRPMPGVDVLVESAITEREQVAEGTDRWVGASCAGSFRYDGSRYGGGVRTESHANEYTIDDVAQSVTATAEPTRLATPIRSIAWTLDGTSVSGSGTITIDSDHEVEYAVDGNEITLETALGEDLNVVAEATIVDDRGVAAAGDEYISLDGMIKEGGRSQADIEQIAETLKKCGRMRRRPPIRRPGVRPDPLPPWAGVDGVGGDVVLPEAIEHETVEEASLGDTLEQSFAGASRLDALGHGTEQIEHALRRGRERRG